jgi:hypothetical protein
LEELMVEVVVDQDMFDNMEEKMLGYTVEYRVEDIAESIEGIVESIEDIVVYTVEYRVEDIDECMVGYKVEYKVGCMVVDKLDHMCECYHNLG